jgi:predicted transcriptional regulator
MEQNIKNIAVNASQFIRTQVKKLPMSDDDKLRTVMNVTGIVAAIFVDALSQTTGISRTHIIMDLTQTIEEVLKTLNNKRTN